MCQLAPRGVILCLNSPRAPVQYAFTVFHSVYVLCSKLARGRAGARVCMCVRACFYVAVCELSGERKSIVFAELELCMAGEQFQSSRFGGYSWI